MNRGRGFQVREMFPSGMAGRAGDDLGESFVDPGQNLAGIDTGGQPLAMIALPARALHEVADLEVEAMPVIASVFRLIDRHDLFPDLR